MRARPVFPNETILSTRCVHKRQLLLKPTRAVNQAIEYITAVLVDEYGLELHALTVLGNHKHDVSTDPNAAIVDFQRDCHQLIARCLNARHKDFESLWSSRQTSRVTLRDPQTIIEKIAYTLANPATSFLVEDSSEWPGVRAAWPAPPKVVKRPSWFFRSEDKGGTWPAEATLRFVRPPGFDHLTDDELVERIRIATELEEETARRERVRRNIKCVGLTAIERQSRYDYPRSQRKHFGMRPRVAAKSKWARIETLQRNRLWDEQYAEAFAQYRAGASDVEFPFGTYKMRVVHGVRCRPPPSA